ncbi:MAG: amidohydrolase [Synergistaceae bacterium]|jgi:amidohydrolase|nr:amidohydrolase [Synergistaceae bacterium]
MSIRDIETAIETGMKLLSEAEGMSNDIVEWRRTFHQFPEIGLEERVTASKIEGILSSLPGMEVFKGFGLPTCVIGRIGGDISREALAFRIEIDAVEVHEDTGLPFSSYDSRISHVQGHDAHMASMLGAAVILSDHRTSLKRPVVFIFQPAEEGKGGAQLLIEAGLIEEFNIEKMLCVHWVPHLPYGQIFTNRGPVTAFSSKLHIGLTGQGGHGSTPYLTSDPLYLSAQVQITLQSVITREVDPQKGAVLSFGRIEAAEVYNVIAEEVHLWGTLRSTDRNTHDFLKHRVEEVVKALAHLTHIGASVEYTLDYGQVVNNDTLVSDIFQIGTALIGSDAMELLTNPLLVGEDFSFYAEQIPSCIMFLGTGMDYGLYHARYDIPENLLPFASAWAAYLALFL